MEPIKVVISDNRMAAFVLIAPGCDAKPQDIRDALKREGVTKGISPKALQEAATSDRGMIYQVAWGIPPSKPLEGSAWRVTPVFNYPESKGRPPEVFSVDSRFKDAWSRLQARGAVSSGSTLAFLRLPSGLPKATAVTGDEVPYIGDSQFKLGPNTSLSTDGLQVLATRPGIPYLDESGAAVLDHITVEGDIGSYTGSVSFAGDLTVRGNVEAGFSVSAASDLLVGGNIWGSATVRGKLVVSGGIIAPGEVIEAGTGIVCRFCENSIVRSRGPIAVQDALIHSVVETDDSVEVSGGIGRIVGGMVRAARSLHATTVGTPMGVPTVIELGVSPRLRREVARLERDLAKITAELSQARRSGRTRAYERSDMDAIRISRVRRHLEDQEKALSDRLDALNQRLEEMPRGFFEAAHVLPGTRLVMGTDVHEFTSALDRITMGVRET